MSIHYLCRIKRFSSCDTSDRLGVFVRRKTVRSALMHCHIFAYLATLRFDRKARDMQQKYELRMKEIREEMAFGSDVFLGNVNEVGYSPISKEKQRKKQIQQIEELDA